MNEYLLGTILIIHWIADFVLQTHKQASRKAVSNSHLWMHCFNYSLVWMLVSSFFVGWNCFPFFLATFVAHFCTDYVTSRMVKKRFDAGDYHNGFVVIGLDQILHYVQLYLTFKLLL